MENKNELKDNLKSIRKIRKLSQEKLSKMAEISPRILQMYESGEISPNVDTLFKLAIALNVNPTDLIGENKKLMTNGKSFNELTVTDLSEGLTNMKPTPNNIKIERVRKGYKQYQLANLVGISPQYLRKLEIGQAINPSHELIKKLAVALEVSIPKLIGYEMETEIKTVVKEMHDLTAISTEELLKELLRRENQK